MSETCDGLPFSTSDGGGFVLESSPRSLRTSLLFDVACRIADSTDSDAAHVLFICRKRPTEMPLLKSKKLNKEYIQAPPLNSTLSRITMHYPSSHNALRSLIASLPIPSQPPPSCILIDDLSTFFHPAHDSSDQIRFTLALLQQSVNTIREAYNIPCFFGVSDLTEKYLPRFWSLHSGVLSMPERKRRKREETLEGSVALMDVYNQCVDWVVSVQGSYPHFTLERRMTPYGLYRLKERDDAVLIEDKYVASVSVVEAKILCKDGINGGATTDALWFEYNS